MYKFICLFNALIVMLHLNPSCLTNCTRQIISQIIFKAWHGVTVTPLIFLVEFSRIISRKLDHYVLRCIKVPIKFYARPLTVEFLLFLQSLIDTSTTRTCLRCELYIQGYHKTIITLEFRDYDLYKSVMR